MSAQAELCLLLVLFLSMLTDAELGPFKQLFGWKEFDFEFPSKAARQEALTSGDFVPGNSQPIDLQYADHRIFLTMPRWKDGIPATLATVPSSPRECKYGHLCSPRLRPLPNWDWNNEKKGCEGLTSVFGVNMDICGHLWVLDSGVVNMLTSKYTDLCPPKLLSFDLATNRLTRRFTFPNSVIKCTSLLVTVALDTISTKYGCRNTFAYSADMTGYGLIVTDIRRENSWRVENKLFYPYPNWGTFNISGETLDVIDGVVSLAIHPAKRKLYFHSLASATECYVPMDLLHNASQVNVRTADFISLRGEKPSQAVTSAFDSRGILFFGLLSKNSITCWNPSTLHNPLKLSRCCSR